MYPGIETIVEPQQLGRGMDMPFADQCGVVAEGLEILGQGWLGQMHTIGHRILGQRGPALLVPSDKVAQATHTRATVLTREETGARWHADRVIGHSVLKGYPLARQAVDVGRANHGVAVAAHLERTQLVAHADHDVR